MGRSKYNRYKVYIVDDTFHGGKHSVTERVLGETYASSPAKAISNMVYRMELGKIESSYGSDYSRVTSFRAEVV